MLIITVDILDNSWACPFIDH